jgi:hypothetical protein
MRRFITETWFPATVSALLTGMIFLVLARDVEGNGWVAPVALAGVAGIVTPLVWWRVVARRPAPGRGALAGAICGGAVIISLILFVVGDSVWRHQIQGQPWDQMESYSYSFGLAILVMGVLPSAVVIGAIVGLVIAIGMRRLGLSGAPEAN